MAAPRTPAAGYGMISIAEAQRIVLENTHTLSAVDVPVSESVGFVVAEDVQAKEPLPPFPASIKDGYAVCSSDGSGTLTVVGDVLAGNSGDIQVVPGTCAYITTGAPIPPGADAVVMIEDTESLPAGSDGKKSVNIKTVVKKGEDIRPVGCDIETGMSVVSVGDRIGIAEVGLLATVGATTVKVHPQPKVMVLSNGDEIVEAGTQKLEFGKIRDSNRPMLIAAVKEAGGDVIDMGIAGDSEGSLESKFKKALDTGADVIITSGGVSMGAKDLIKPLLESLGKVHFGKVKMKPGKPLTFATIDHNGRQVLVFALPGNPVSSYACFKLVVLPALNKFMGCATPLPRRVDVELAADTNLDPQRPEYARATVRWKSGGGFVAESAAGSQRSSRLLSARSANVLLELPQEEGVLSAGSTVTALVIDDLRSMPAKGEV
ncbi:hypothetical protein BSKO_00336 [Bryopsis sp. KO-2023]|nr:hypothetical protein BSKO_00336 [Bryopsis sp. KO-2023]